MNYNQGSLKRQNKLNPCNYLLNKQTIIWILNVSSFQFKPPAFQDLLPRTVCTHKEDNLRFLCSCLYTAAAHKAEWQVTFLLRAGLPIQLCKELQYLLQRHFRQYRYSTSSPHTHMCIYILGWWSRFSRYRRLKLAN